MPLIVQNNTGTTAGANAYIDSAFADSYFVDLNKDDTEWAGLDQEEKDAAIISATSYIDNVNMGKFLGVRLTEGQLTQFPRINIYDYDGYPVYGVPELLKRATAEYALRAVVDSLAPDLTYDDSGIPIKSKLEKVGPITEQTVYQDDVLSPTTIKKYPEADMLLKQYVQPNNYLVRG